MYNADSRGRSSARPVRAVLGLLGVLAGCVALAACGGSGSSSTAASTEAEPAPESTSTPASEAGKPSGKKIVIGYSDPAAANPTQQAVARGQQEASKELGWELIHEDANLSPSKQVSDIESLISRHVDGINSFTIDQGAADAVYKRASAAGIPVIGQSSTSPYIVSTVWNEQNYSCAVANRAAKYIADRIPDAKTLVMGGPPVGAIIEYVKCFTKAAAAAGLEVLDQKDNTSDSTAGAQPIAEAMINENPDVQAIWSYGDTTSLGAGNALKAAGKPVWEEGGDESGAIVIGSNGSTEAIEGIENGLMTATYDINPDQVGSALIADFAQHFVDGVPLEELPKNVVVPATLWDASNVSEYVPPLEREINLAAAEKLVQESK